jgi:hypothetical protein
MNKDDMSWIHLRYSLTYLWTCRNQDKRYVYTAIGESEGRGGELMLTWLENNYDAVRDFYAETFVYNVKNMLIGFAEEASSAADAERLSAFLVAHRADLGSAAVTIEQGLDKISANIKWRDAFFDDVADWFVTSRHLTGSAWGVRGGVFSLLCVIVCVFLV